ncbi:MAG: endonuclease/exonuclease/phosphatase family protein [Phycisphaerales bacterium]
MSDEGAHGAEEVRSTRGLWYRVVSVGSVCVVLGALVWWVVYGLSSRVWVADMLLNGTAQVLGAGWMVWAGVVMSRRGWIEAVGLVGLLSVSAVLLGGRPLVRVGGGDDRRSDQQSISVVTMNIFMANQQPEQVLELIRSFEDDVVVLVEPQWDVFRRFLDGDDGADQFGYRVLRRRIGNEAAPMVILSRWGIERDEGVDELLGISGLILRPDDHGGPFELTGIHIRSPRSYARWSKGNGELEELIRSVEREDRSNGIRRVVVGDLNGGPGTARDRRLRGGFNMVRSSSMMGLSGTFPANLSIFGVGIDDIWISEGFDVLSWESIEIPGSDHRGVRVVIR